MFSGVGQFEAMSGFFFIKFFIEGYNKDVLIKMRYYKIQIHLELSDLLFFPWEEKQLNYQSLLF